MCPQGCKHGLNCGRLRAVLPSHTKIDFICRIAECVPVPAPKHTAHLKSESGRVPAEMVGFAVNVLMLIDQDWWTRVWGAVSYYLYHFGGLGVMLLAILDSSFLSVPEGNDLLIVILSAGKSWGTMAYYVGMTTIGSVIGCILLYSVGRKGGSPILKRRFAAEKIERAEKLFERFGILTVLIPSILPPPLPFKIFVLSAGVFRLNILSFLVAVVIGRTIRYSVWGVLAVLYGNPVKRFMQQNLKEVGIVFFGVFALMSALTILYYVRHMKAHKIDKPNSDV